MIYIVLLNWNGGDDTIACLESIRHLKCLAPKVVICDNASSDDSWAKLSAYILSQVGLDIQLVQTGSNLGFAGGNNVGLRLALSDPEMQFAWVLNNDTEVASEALSYLLAYMNAHPDVGICGSTLLYADDPSLIQAVGGQYNPWLGTSKHVLGHQKFSQAICESVDPDSFDYVVGASMFVRRAVLERVGLLSEDYFLYCEEIDWATRVKRQMPEMRLGYARESLVYHKEGASTGVNDRQEKTYRYFADYFFITSRLKFARKYYPLHSLVVQASMLLVTLNRVRRGQWRSAAVALCCFCGVIPGFMDPREGVST